MRNPGRMSLLAVSALSVSCAADPAPSEPTAPAVVPAAAQTGPAALEGTSWRLVEIRSMDDRVFTPDAPGRFTLTFQADGTLAVQADCNRGTGTWTREGTSGLQLGPIAMTAMACSPESIEARFRSDLGYIRSFVERDGHIFLATMADGAILEFEPLSPANGPAFDCAQADGTVEERICEDMELAALDVRLDRLYHKALETYPPEEIDSLKAFQRGWIKGRNDCWKADDLRACVVESYRIRITELQIGTGDVLVPEAVAFDCGGESITAVLHSETELPAAVLTRVPDDQVVAYRVPAASGAKYEGRNVMFWTKGNEATVTWSGRDLRCTTR